VAAALQGRYSLLQSIAEQLLQALSFCHQRGVAHCGLGTGSVVLNTWQVGRPVQQQSALQLCIAAAVAVCRPLSLMLLALQDKEVHRLMVKLDNFGLSRLYPHPLETPSSGKYGLTDRQSRGR